MTIDAALSDAANAINAFDQSGRLITRIAAQIASGSHADPFRTTCTLATTSQNAAIHNSELGNTSSDAAIDSANSRNTTIRRTRSDRDKLVIAENYDETSCLTSPAPS